MRTTYLKNQTLSYIKTYEWIKLTETHIITIWENKVEIEERDETETYETTLQWFLETYGTEETTQEVFDEQFKKVVKLINSISNQ